jgi:hypothetical protein
MLKIIFGIFIVLHGLVHLLYFGQSTRFFELTPGLTWPDGSWVFSKFLDQAAIRNLTSGLLILSAIGFMISGVGLFMKQDWWRSVIIVTGIFSSMVYILTWDGILQAMHNKGFVGVLINLAILAVVIIWKNIF